MRHPGQQAEPEQEEGDQIQQGVQPVSAGPLRSSLQNISHLSFSSAWTGLQTGGQCYVMPYLGFTGYDEQLAGVEEDGVDLHCEGERHVGHELVGGDGHTIAQDHLDFIFMIFVL